MEQRIAEAQAAYVDAVLKLPAPTTLTEVEAWIEEGSLEERLEPFQKLTDKLRQALRSMGMRDRDVTYRVREARSQVIRARDCA